MVTVMTLACASIIISPAPAEASLVNPWPTSVVNGFSTPNGAGFWLTLGDGTVGSSGSAGWYGDAHLIPLNGPIVGGAATPTGNGYWLDATDGGIFTYGGAHFYGSMGAAHLNQPVFSMAPTKTGKGYWLVARDGGIFTFGDGHFYGSTGSIKLNQPINGITTGPTGQGYRMVARDGGIFSFGDVPFYGSLPGIGLNVSDVVGMAPTPTGRGYWIARSNGDMYSFGDAHYFGNYTPSPCDPVKAIFANPQAQGYRLVTDSGATIPFGSAPGGSNPTGTPRQCPPPPPPPPGPPNPPTMSLAEFNSIQPGMSYEQVAAIVGGPGTLSVSETLGGITDTIYTWDGEGSLGANALVQFQNDQEITKAQAGLA